VAIAAIGGAFLFVQKTQAPPANTPLAGEYGAGPSASSGQMPTSSVNTNPPASSTGSTPNQTTTPPPPQPSPVSISITADVSGGSPTTLNVQKGALVRIAFNVKPTGVYYGGLDFRSSVVST